MRLANKNKYLLAGIVAMLLLSYRLAIHRTLALREAYGKNMEKKESISNLPMQLSMLGQKEKVLDGQLAALDASGSSAQNNLLKFLNREATKNKVKVIDFNAPHVVEGENGSIQTSIFLLEGGYTDILKTLNALENRGIHGAISHVRFEKKKNFRSKRTYLQAQVFLERMK